MAPLETFELPWLPTDSNNNDNNWLNLGQQRLNVIDDDECDEFNSFATFSCHSSGYSCSVFASIGATYSKCTATKFQWQIAVAQCCDTSIFAQRWQYRWCTSESKGEVLQLKCRPAHGQSTYTNSIHWKSKSRIHFHRKGNNTADMICTPEFTWMSIVSTKRPLPNSMPT